MRLAEHRTSQILLIKQADKHNIKVAEKNYNQSIILSRMGLQELTAPVFQTALNSKLLKIILEQAPQVLIIGCDDWSQKITEVSLQKQLKQLQQQGINHELMGLIPSCRTWNIMSGDQRDVMLIAVLNQ